MKITFSVHVMDGEIPVELEGDSDFMDAVLKKFKDEGMTVQLQNGLVWYPPHAIRKITVLVHP